MLRSSTLRCSDQAIPDARAFANVGEHANRSVAHFARRSSWKPQTRTKNGDNRETTEHTAKPARSANVRPRAFLRRTSAHRTTSIVTVPPPQPATLPAFVTPTFQSRSLPNAYHGDNRFASYATPCTGCWTNPTPLSSAIMRNGPAIRSCVIPVAP